MSWRRDPGVSSMVEWFDVGIPNKYKISQEEWVNLDSAARFSMLSSQEKQAIYEQGALCVEDFSYAARNYFWITNKKKKDVLMSLTEAQYLILQKHYELKAKRRAQKLMVLKARQLGALDPHSMVRLPGSACSHMRNLRVGQEVFAFDEYDTSLSENRKIQISTIRDLWSVVVPSYRVLLDNGHWIIASGDHLFLCGCGVNAGLGDDQVYRWISVDDLAAGDSILHGGELVENSGLDLLSAGFSPVKIRSIEDIGPRLMLDVRTSTGTFVANGFATHNCSTLIEAMIAWRSMFFPNTNAIVVATDKEQSSYLFGIMQHIYDMMPWWLRPMCASRKIESGLKFDNPDPNLRSVRPGLHSEVMVAASTQFSGVGEGRRVDAAHVSEYAGYDEYRAEEIIEEDLLHAMDDNEQVFGFLESTAKGAGTYAHRLWRVCERRMERAEWYPLFIPWFFETTRVLAPPQGWRPGKKEGAMRERVLGEWVRCNNSSCGLYKLATIRGESIVGEICPECKNGILRAYALTDEQLYWKQEKRENAEEKGKSALKKHTQELSSTAEECFQVSGYTLFTDECLEFVNSTVREPIKSGRIYRTGEIHGANGRDGKCYLGTCKDDHRYDDTPLMVWEEPIPGKEYTVGVDVAEGIGADYSVIFVNKKGGCNIPDEQVAVWRDNNTPPKELAFYCNVIGRWYNDAMMCIEYNTYQTTGDDVVHVWQYPNVFRWKNKETTTLLTHKWHWWTKANTKSYLHQTAVHWLQNNLWVIRSKNFHHEMTVYKKDEFDSRTMGAETGFNDDEILAGFIALYCTHEMDADESGRVPVPARVESEEPAKYGMECTACKFKWGAVNPEQEYCCPKCSCIRLKGKMLEEPKQSADIVGLKFDSNGRPSIDPSVYKQMSRGGQSSHPDHY